MTDKTNTKKDAEYYNELHRFSDFLVNNFLPSSESIGLGMSSAATGISELDKAKLSKLISNYLNSKGFDKKAIKAAYEAAKSNLAEAYAENMKNYGKNQKAYYDDRKAKQTPQEARKNFNAAEAKREATYRGKTKGIGADIKDLKSALKHPALHGISKHLGSLTIAADMTQAIRSDDAATVAKTGLAAIAAIGVGGG